MAALLFAAALPLRLRKGSRKVDGSAREVLLETLRDFLKSPSGADPLHLHLRLRPLFPSLDGRLASLRDLERRARRDPLLAARPGAALVHHLRPGVLVLDRSDRLVDALLPELPDCLVLEELDAIVDAARLSGALEPLSRALRSVAPDIRLCAVRGRADVREAVLPLRGLPQRHVVVGLDAEALSPSLREADPALAAFRAAQYVIDRSSLLSPYRERLLGILAEAYLP